MRLERLGVRVDDPVDAAVADGVRADVDAGCGQHLDLLPVDLRIPSLLAG